MGTRGGVEALPISPESREAAAKLSLGAQDPTDAVKIVKYGHHG